MIDLTKLKRANSGKSTFIAARVQPTVKKEIEAFCAAEGITTSALLAAMIMEFLENQLKGVKK